uniref:Uncharacterized protein n=1 Tax=Glossina pallidipes TaxID=7398 RepID=A0A1B0A7F7_GLOPL
MNGRFTELCVLPLHLNRENIISIYCTFKNKLKRYKSNTNAPQHRLHVFTAALFTFALAQPSHILRSTEASLLCFNIKKKRNLLIVRVIILHTDDDDNGDGGGGEHDDVANKIVKMTYIKFILPFATTTKCLEDKKIKFDNCARYSQHLPKTENWIMKTYRVELDVSCPLKFEPDNNYNLKERSQDFVLVIGQ